MRMHNDTSSSALDVRLWSGGQALTWCRRNERRWRDLQYRCGDDNTFVAPAFVATWYAHYHDLWTPLVAVGQLSDGRLAGILPLACDESNRFLTAAGANQCEYHGWLCEPGSEPAFLSGLAQRLGSGFPGYTLVLNHIRGRQRIAALQHSPFAPRLDVTTHRKPILEIDLARIAASEKKSGNRSKLKRLQANGPIETARAETADELSPLLDPIANDYDFRQGAANDVTPFAADARKKPFHLAWMEAAPQDFYALALVQRGRIIAGLIGTVIGDGVSVDIQSHAPELANYSPGKFLLYQAARDLEGTDIAKLDLTPGGDAWKDRMATGSEEVWSVRIHPSARARRLAHAYAASRATANRSGRRRPAAAIRRCTARARRATPRAILARLTYAFADRSEYRVYRFSLPAHAFPRDNTAIRLNSTHDLVRLAQAIADHGLSTRGDVLVQASERLKNGHLVYTYRNDDVPVHHYWVAPRQSESHFTEINHRFRYPMPGPVCYDALTLPHARGGGYATATLARALVDLAHHHGADTAYVSTLAENKASERSITKNGGTLLVRLIRRKLLGWERVQYVHPTTGAFGQPGQCSGGSVSGVASGR